MMDTLVVVHIVSGLPRHLIAFVGGTVVVLILMCVLALSTYVAKR